MCLSFSKRSLILAVGGINISTNQTAELHSSITFDYKMRKHTYDHKGALHPEWPSRKY